MTRKDYMGAATVSSPILGHCGVPQSGVIEPQGGTMTNKKAVRKQEQEEAIARLRETLKPGDTVHTILRHVSRSGMSRSISVVRMDVDGPFDISYLVARAIEENIDRTHGGVKVGGCGMDMGFALVYSTSAVLFPDGFDCVGEGCPASDHANGDRSYNPHPHQDGGYALKQRWL